MFDIFKKLFDNPPSRGNAVEDDLRKEYEELSFLCLNYDPCKFVITPPSNSVEDRPAVVPLDGGRASAKAVVCQEGEQLRKLNEQKEISSLLKKYHLTHIEDPFMVTNELLKMLDKCENQLNELERDGKDALPPLH